jgi:hypothetical protein
MANRRRQGHTFEREVVNLLKSYFPDEYFATTRADSRKQDNEGNDIMNPFGFRIQCKKQVVTGNNVDISSLNEVNSREGNYDYSLLFIKLTGKTETRESSKGNFVVLSWRDFLDIAFLGTESYITFLQFPPKIYSAYINKKSSIKSTTLPLDFFLKITDKKLPYHLVLPTIYYTDLESAQRLVIIEMDNFLIYLTKKWNKQPKRT